MYGEKTMNTIQRRHILRDIGCGTNKKQGYLGIDKVKLRGVDIICDVEHGLPFKDNTVDEILVWNILET